MKLFTPQQYDRLCRNGSDGQRCKDHVPVVKLFMPNTKAIWLITEIDPYEPVTAYGLCDVGVGRPELNYVYLPYLNSVRGPLGQLVKRDPLFRGEYPISVYAEAAYHMGGIVLGSQCLDTAEAFLANRP